MSSLLNIVNENDEIIGQETREEIHRAGLLHRETFVYFITPQREIIFQHRAKDKDICPNLLSTTVGGHVEIGQSYEEAAIREVEEETGVKLNVADLIIINKSRRKFQDELTGRINDVFRTDYLYVYLGKISDLKVEPKEATGFEFYSLKQLAALDDKERARFTPLVLGRIASIDWEKFLKNYPV